MIGVDPDTFFIDVDQTITTTAGEKSYNSNAVKEATESVTDAMENISYRFKPRRKNEGHIQLSEYFMTVSLVEEETN